MEDKKTMRLRLLAERAALPERERAAFDAAMQTRLLARPEYRAAKTVFCYVSMSPEPSTWTILTDALRRGKRVLVPRCRAGGEMDAVEIRSLRDLRPGAFGIPEPAAELPAADPATIDLAVVPALACDAMGNRLGRGGGYYDRFLAGRRFRAICLCYARCPVPAEEHDQRADIVISPTERKAG